MRFVLAGAAAVLAAHCAFAGAKSSCTDQASTTAFQSPDSVWWGNVERAHTPYLEFAKTDLPEPPDELYTVYFNQKKAELSPAAIATMNEVFAYLDTNDSLRAEITHGAGGRRNANAARDWLISQGIAPDRIKISESGGEGEQMSGAVRIRVTE